MEQRKSSILICSMIRELIRCSKLRRTKISMLICWFLLEKKSSSLFLRREALFFGKRKILALRQSRNFLLPWNPKVYRRAYGSWPLTPSSCTQLHNATSHPYTKPILILLSHLISHFPSIQHPLQFLRILYL